LFIAHDAAEVTVEGLFGEGGSALAAGGGVGLVAGEAAEAPGEESGALGQVVLGVADGDEALDEGLAVGLPVLLGFESGDDGEGGEEVVGGEVGGGQGWHGVQSPW